MNLVIGKLYKSKAQPTTEMNSIVKGDQILHRKYVIPPWSMPPGTLGVLLDHNPIVSNMGSMTRLKFLVGDRVIKISDLNESIDGWLEGPL